MAAKASLHDRIRREIRTKLAYLKVLQNLDGGIPAYVRGDPSGVWASAEVLYSILNHRMASPTESWIKQMAAFLKEQQHGDGGWSYRQQGESFVDPCCWALLSLALFGERGDAIVRGIEFLLGQQTVDPTHDDGWGMQAGEHDRIYSTSIAIYTFSKLRTLQDLHPSLLARMEAAAARGLAFLRQAMNLDGGWGARPQTPSNPASTAHALVCLFKHGENPSERTQSLTYLIANKMGEGFAWESIDEILPLKNGLEVTMQWFTQPDVLKALLFFAELKVADIDAVVRATEALFEFSSANSSEVHYTLQGRRRPYTWTLPHYLDALGRVRRFLSEHRDSFAMYSQGVREREREEARRSLLRAIETEYPYPLAEAYFRYMRETDHLTRFRRMILSVEALVVFLSSALLVMLSQTPSAASEGVRKDLATHFGRPSFGEWVRLFIRLAQSLAEQEPVAREMCTMLECRVERGGAESTSLKEVLAQMVSVRNRYWAHGGMMSAYEYKRLTDEYAPVIEELYARVACVAGMTLFFVIETEFDEFDEKDTYTIVSCRGLRFHDSQSRIESTRRLSKGMSQPDVRYVYLQTAANATALNLYPLWSFRYCEECKGNRFFAYASVRDAGIEYVSYECGHVASLANRGHYDVLIRRATIHG